MPRSGGYDELVDRVRALLGDEADLIANAANTAAILFHSLAEINWVGFYFLRDGQLVLGPFQGQPACTRIPLGKGVCGTAAQRRSTIVVNNVHEFPGHIACDPKSNSEIVVPLIQDGQLIGVLDIDSPGIGRFGNEDRKGLESVAQVILERSDAGQQRGPCR